MKHRVDYSTGLAWGAGIGGVLGLFTCFYTVSGSSNSSNGNPVFQGFATLLVLIVIGAAVSLLLVYLLNCEYDTTSGNVHTRSRLDYFESVLHGALIGAVLGVTICNFACISKSGDYKSVSGVYWGAFFFMAVIGAVIGPVVAYFYNKETDRLNEKDRKQREYEAECTNIENQINYAFSRAGQNLLFAQDVLQCMESHKSNPDYRNAVNAAVVGYEDRIYNETIDAWLSGNFKAVESGLSILSEACSFRSQYETALARLQDKKKLLAVMEQNGLPKSSPLMKRFLYIFD